MAKLQEKELIINAILSNWVFLQKKFNLLKDSNPIRSTLKFKCPRCHQGDLFLNKSVYQYKGFFDMPKRCPKCGQDFEIETGFYYGAMYSSYAVTVAITVAVFTLVNLLNIFSLTSFLILDAITLIATMPYVVKISRSIWIATIIPFDPKAQEYYEAQHRH